MKILQRDLNRSTFVVWEMKRNVSVVKLLKNCRVWWVVRHLVYINILNYIKNCPVFFFLAQQHPKPHPPGVTASLYTRFLDHTHRRTTVGRTPLDVWSARRKDLYLTTHNNHDRHPCHWWDSNSHSQQASGHWDRRNINISNYKHKSMFQFW